MNALTRPPFLSINILKGPLLLNPSISHLIYRPALIHCGYKRVARSAAYSYSCLPDDQS